MRGEGGVGVERARIPETGSMFSKRTCCASVNKQFFVSRMYLIQN